MSTIRDHSTSTPVFVSHSSKDSERPLIIGGGIGGLTAALRLAIKGLRPIVLERADTVGGKAHQIDLSQCLANRVTSNDPINMSIDGGPTVMTMIHIFEELFSDAGANLYERLDITPAEVLARHFGRDGSQLDLFTDFDASYQAIKDFAGSSEANGFTLYHRYADQIYQSVSDIFIYSEKPSPLKMVSKMGLSILPRMLKADVHRKMWRSLSQYFKDDRLRQLFGRYATYAGNNPFMTPGTFNLIAAVEQNGVWRVRGGILALANALQDLIIRHGGEVRTSVDVSNIYSDHGRITGVWIKGEGLLKSSQVIFNGDVQALSSGLLGESVQTAVKAYPKRERSLSALTLCAMADMRKAPLIHHNVWFSDNYREEFESIESGRLPSDPTVYICAQDRGDQIKRDPQPPLDIHNKSDEAPMSKHSVSDSVSSHYERLFALVNAPARSDYSPLKPEEILTCQVTVNRILKQLEVTPSPIIQQWTTPTNWAERFPASGGAIYGRATRRWDSNLKRMGAKTKLKGLYLTGGSVHPGAGVPMAAISGNIAAAQLINDCALIEN